MNQRKLASTMLGAAAALAAGDAAAQTSFQPSGSPPSTTQNIPSVGGGWSASAAQGPRFVIRISGFLTSYIAATWQDERGTSTTDAQSPATTGPAITSPFNNARVNRTTETGEGRIRFNPEIGLDNGFRGGGMLEFNFGAGSFTSRRTFAYLISDRFGEIRIGNQNLPVYEMEYREPALARGYTDQIPDNLALQHLIFNPTGSSFANGTMFGGPDDGLAGQDRANGITYYSPRIEGFQLGAMFAPELSQNRSTISATGLENGTQATYHNAWSVAVNYNRTFESGIVVRLSGGYSRAYAPEQGGQGSSQGSPSGVGLAAGTGTQNAYWWYVGGQIGYRGLSVGGAYGRSAFRNFSTGSNDGTPAFFNTVVQDGYNWTAGITYQYGPYAVGLAYMDGRNSDCSTTGLALGACGSRDRNTIVILMGSYQIGPGVFWETGVFHTKLTGNEWNNGTFVGTTPVAGGLIATSATGVAQSGLQSNRANGVWTGLAIVF
jgi:predicted porin